MKTMLKVLSAVALTSVMVLPVLADDATTDSTTDAKDQKDLKKVIEDQGINYVETAQKGITLSGYVDVSYTEQFAGRGTPSSPSGSTQASLHEFDQNNDNFNVQAVKLALEKALPDKNEWAAGFRVDAILGSDAKELTDSAFGSTSSSGGTTSSTSYPIALEQALVKFRIPVGNGLDIYAGKFVTFLGYEVIESPANPNFSRGLLFTNAIPLTNTGVYADYKFNDTLEAKFGVVDGSNNSVSQGSADPMASYGYGGKAITGQLNINAPGKNANITQSFIYAPDSTSASGTPTIDNGPLFIYDIWGNWNPTFVKDSALTLGFNVDFGYNGASGIPTDVGAGTPGVHDSNTWYGVALYSIYKFNKVFSLAGRAEYLHTDAAYFPQYGPNTTDYTGTTPGAPIFTPAQDDFSYTLTASFNIWDNLLTRAEYRIDDLSGSSTVSAGGQPGTSTKIQNEVSLEAVYSF
jgi:Putative beta-barrel porin-2, OmpL-like. bbp2